MQWFSFIKFAYSRMVSDGSTLSLEQSVISVQPDLSSVVQWRSLGLCVHFLYEWWWCYTDCDLWLIWWLDMTNWSSWCLVHTIDADKTRLCCLVGGVNRVGDSLWQFSGVLNILKTEQFCQLHLRCEHHRPSCNLETWSEETKFSPRRILTLDKTAKTTHIQFQNFLLLTVLTCLQFSSHRRQDSRCELGFTEHVFSHFW